MTPSPHGIDDYSEQEREVLRLREEVERLNERLSARGMSVAPDLDFMHVVKQRDSLRSSLARISSLAQVVEGPENSEPMKELIQAIKEAAK